MSKITIFVLTLLLAILNFAISANVECDYGMHNFYTVGDKYRCLVSNNLIIDSPEEVQIEAVTGSHISGKTSDDEIYFRIEDQPIQYFPRGMEKFFKNLKGIVIWNSQIKEIHQEDLKPYNSLNYLSISGSNMEIIEEGLFDFNPEMETIIFEKSKIFHISSNVFDNLPKLTTLYLYMNRCISEHSTSNRDETLEVIKYVKSSCTSSD